MSSQDKKKIPDDEKRSATGGEVRPGGYPDVPLAVRMRPRDLEEYAGQSHLLGKGKLLRRAIEADRLTSLILFGPPGTGKTSLAWCISRITKARYVALNATTSNVEQMRSGGRAAKAAGEDPFSSMRYTVSTRRSVMCFAA